MASKGITANQVTVAAILISAMTGLYLTLSIFYQTQTASAIAFLSLPLVLFIRMALNAIDGMLAREHAMQSDLGALLNELGDVISDSALYLPFALLPFINPYLIVAIVLVAILTEMVGVIALQMGASRRYDGPMGKSDRAFIFGLLALLIGFGWLQSVSVLWMNALLLLILMLSLLTVINRAKKALTEIKKEHRH
jgi:CDP-diacylglycerol--glycerol-3-phosphate 3-phosphatidyltransferase